MARELAARARMPRNWLFAAVSATLLVALLAGTAFLACGPDGKRCAASMHTFMGKPVPSKMDVDVLEGEAHVHVHKHGSVEGIPGWPNVKKFVEDKMKDGANKLQELRNIIQTRYDPNSIWGPIVEDDQDPAEIHCGEMEIPVAEKIANGEWPEDLTASRNGLAVECKGGKVDPGSGIVYDCDGVDLLSFVPLDDFFGSLKANDIWGWEDPETGKEYAIIGLGEGTGFVDISDPMSPIVVAVMPSTNFISSTWRDIKVYNNRAYVVSEARGHGMQVFDLTRLRGRNSPPTVHDDPDTTFFGDGQSFSLGSAHNIVINEATGRAYPVGARNQAGSSRACSGGLCIIDISQPTPVFEYCFSDDGYTHDAECVIYHGPDEDHQGKEICVGYNEDTVTVVDVTRASGEPTLISRRPYENDHYTHQGWFDEAHEFIYVNDELDELRMTDKRTRTLIFDLRDLDNPMAPTEYRHAETSIDHNNYIIDGLVYQGNYCAGLRVLKINEEHGLQDWAYFDTEPQCSIARFEGVWSVYPYFKSQSIVVSSVPKGLFVLKLQKDRQP